jgi:hypothetical protein
MNTNKLAENFRLTASIEDGWTVIRTKDGQIITQKLGTSSASIAEAFIEADLIMRGEYVPTMEE